MDGAEWALINYIFIFIYSHTYADGAECAYDEQQAREHTTVAELALA